MGWVDDLVKELHGQGMDVFKVLVGVVLKYDRSILPITSNGKNVENKFCLIYSLVRRTRNKFNLGSYVTRELYEEIYSEGKVFIKNTTD